MKRYRIEYDPAATKALRAIRDRRIKLPLQAALAGLMENPRPHGCEKMIGERDRWRIRVGTWRVVYRIDDGVLVVEVVRVAPRGEVYRGL